MGVPTIQKPHHQNLQKKKTPCNTEKVPTVVPGLSRDVSSSSSAFTPTSSSTQDSTRRSSPRSPRTSHGETRCMICQTGYRSLPKIEWMAKPQRQASKHLVLRNHVVQFLYQEVVEKNTMLTHFPKDRNGEICAKITRATCRKCSGSHIS